MKLLSQHPPYTPKPKTSCGQDWNLSFYLFILLPDKSKVVPVYFEVVGIPSRRYGNDLFDMIKYKFCKSTNVLDVVLISNYEQI